MRKISVVMTLFNSEAHIGDAIKSALAQTYTNREIIVVDDGSTDKSGKIVRQFGDAVMYHYQANSGVAAASNKGVSLSSGDYIAFLEHDDIWLPHKLERQVAILESRPEIGVVNCDLRYVSATGEVEQEVIPGFLPHDTYTRLFQGGFSFWLSATILRRCIFDSIGGFDEGFKKAGLQDLEWYARLMNVAQAFYIPEPLVLFRRHPDRIPNEINLENMEYMLEQLLNRFSGERNKRRYLLKRKVALLSDLGKYRIRDNRIKNGRRHLIHAIRLGLRERVGVKMLFRSALRFFKSFYPYSPWRIK